jgi:hypothetical protein
MIGKWQAGFAELIEPLRHLAYMMPALIRREEECAP